MIFLFIIYLHYKLMCHWLEVEVILLLIYCLFVIFLVIVEADYLFVLLLEVVVLIVALLYIFINDMLFTNGYALLMLLLLAF